MTNKTKITIEATYAALEQTINVNNGDLSIYSSLSRFNGNKSKPIHKWFTYKEGFSSELLYWACERLRIEFNNLEAILDPFCGVGTSLVSAQIAYRGSNQLHVVGIERNPYIAFVARTKVNWPVVVSKNWTED